MAEPYDTINAINSGPEHWWRFSVASGAVTDEGQGSSNTLSAASGDSGAFNGTYQFDTNPFGDGFGIRFNGQGGLLSTPLGLTTTRGTMFVVYRTVGNPTTSLQQFGFFAGDDLDYCSLAINSGGLLRYQLQDDSATQENFQNALGLNDSAVHSMAVQPGTTTTSLPIMYSDASTFSISHTGDGTVDDNYWWNSFTELFAAGFGGGNGAQEVSNMVAYEVLLFDTVLTAQQITDVHNLLTVTFVAPLTKHERRTGRRVFNASVLT